MSQEFSFSLPYAAFDLDLIGLQPADVGSATFTDKVAEFFAGQFATFGGKARVVCNDQAQTIDVKWTQEPHFRDPKGCALAMLRSNRITDAIPLLWTLHRESPGDTDVLFNLGVACSEVGQLEKAIAVLQRLIELDPHHVHGLVALGVAFVRAEQYSRGEDLLRRALRLEPRNLWALRNLGGCLLKLGKSAEALAVLELAIEVGPNDMHTVIGLAQALEEVGRTAEADDLYLRIIRAGGPEQLVLMAKDRRTIIAQQTMRNRAPLRMDVASYLRGAIDKFQGLSTEEVRAIGIEIAMLGQSGLDINNPNPQYTLRSLPGHFSGIHLCAIMYAAFKHFAPQQDVGIDFSKEWEIAMGMRG